MFLPRFTIVVFEPNPRRTQTDQSQNLHFQLSSSIVPYFWILSSKFLMPSEQSVDTLGVRVCKYSQSKSLGQSATLIPIARLQPMPPQPFLLFLLYVLLSPLRCSFFYYNSTIATISNLKLTTLTSNNKLLIAVTNTNNSSLLNMFSWVSTRPQYSYNLTQTIDLGNVTVSLLYLSRDSSFLLVGCTDKGISFYLIDQNYKLKYKTTIEGWNARVDISDDDNYFVFCDKNGSVAIYRNNSLDSLGSTNPSVNVETDKPNLMGNDENLMRDSSTDSVYDISLNYTLFQTIQNNSTVSTLRFSPNCSKIYIAYTNNTLCVYGLTNNSFIFEFKIEIKDDVICIIKLSEMKKALLAGSRRGVVRIYKPIVQGEGLELAQMLFEPEEEISGIRLTNKDLTLLVTTKHGNMFVYTRENKRGEFIFDEGRTLRISKPLAPKKITNYIKGDNASLSANSIDQPPTPSPLSPLIPIRLSLDNSVFLHYSNSSIDLYVACPHSISMCSNCTNNSVCLSCMEYFYVLLDQCHHCPVGCIICKNNRVCFKCDSQHYLNFTLAICYPCNKVLSNCAQCQGSETCTECQKGYILVKKRCVLTDSSPPAVMGASSSSDSIETPVQSQEEDNEGLLTVFVITCLVFVCLMVITGILLVYMSKILLRGSALSQSNDGTVEAPMPLNNLPFSERGISQLAE